MALQAHAVHRLGDQELAQRIFERLESFEKYNVILGTSAVYYGPVPRYLGLLSDTLGRYAEAEEYFRKAVAMSTAMNARVFLVYSQLEYGAMLLRHGLGPKGHALSLVAEAQATASLLGMTLAAQEYGRLLKGQA